MEETSEYIDSKVRAGFPGRVGFPGHGTSSLAQADKPTPLAMGDKVRPFTWLSYAYPALSLTVVVLEQ